MNLQKAYMFFPQIPIKVFVPGIEDDNIGAGIRYNSGDFVFYYFKPGQEAEWERSVPEVLQILGRLREPDCGLLFKFRASRLPNAPSDTTIQTIEWIEQKLAPWRKPCWYDGFSKLSGKKLHTGTRPYIQLLQKLLTHIPRVKLRSHIFFQMAGQGSVKYVA